jgi:hypothetical protein
MYFFLNDLSLYIHFFYYYINIKNNLKKYIGIYKNILFIITIISHDQ